MSKKGIQIRSGLAGKKSALLIVALFILCLSASVVLAGTSCGLKVKVHNPYDFKIKVAITGNGVPISEWIDPGQSRELLDNNSLTAWLGQIKSYRRDISISTIKGEPLHKIGMSITTRHDVWAVIDGYNHYCETWYPEYNSKCSTFVKKDGLQDSYGTLYIELLN